MRRKTRTTFTVLSIVVAFLLFGILAALNMAFSMGVELAGNDRLVITHKVSIIQLLPESYTARLEQTPGVVDVLHQTWFGGIYQKPSNFFMQCPVNPDRLLKLYPEYVLPEDQKKAWLTRPHVRDRRPADGRPLRLQGRRPHSHPGDDLAQEGRQPHLGVQPLRHLRRRQEGRGYDAVLLQLRVLRRGPPVRAGPGRLVRHSHQRPRRRAADRRAHRRAVRQLVRRDEDHDREGVRPGVREAGRRHRRHHPRDRHGRLLHHPAGGGQHDGAVGARAHERTGAS